MDAGLAVNPALVENQMIGQPRSRASSRALHEQVALQQEARDEPRLGHLSDPALQGHAEGHAVVRPAARPAAARRRRAAATAGPAAAIANAFFDATGVRIREAPMTPARVRGGAEGRRQVRDGTRRARVPMRGPGLAVLVQSGPRSRGFRETTVRIEGRWPRNHAWGCASGRSCGRARRSSRSRFGCSPSRGTTTPRSSRSRTPPTSLPSTFFTYFPTKEAVVFDSYEEGVAGLIHRIEDRPGDETTVDAFDSFIRPLIVVPGGQRDRRPPLPRHPRAPGAQPGDAAPLNDILEAAYATATDATSASTPTRSSRNCSQAAPSARSCASRP